MEMRPADLLAQMQTPKFRRNAAMAAFYTVLGLLVFTLLGSYIIPSNSQLSAYDDDWDDISAFRADLNEMGVETHSLVSSPLLLGEIEYPESTVFVIAGVEAGRRGNLPDYSQPESCSNPGYLC